MGVHAAQSGRRTVATTRTVGKKKALVHGHKTPQGAQRAALTGWQALAPMSQPPKSPPARLQPLPSRGATTPPRRRHPPQPPQHLGAALARAPLCLLVKLAGVAQVDRHRHPARRRGQLRRGLGFRLRFRPSTDRPVSQQARKNSTRQKKQKQWSGRDTPTGTQRHSSVGRSARETAADKQRTTASRSEGMSAGKESQGRKKKKITQLA